MPYRRSSRSTTPSVTAVDSPAATAIGAAAAGFSPYAAAATHPAAACAATALPRRSDWAIASIAATGSVARPAQPTSRHASAPHRPTTASVASESSTAAAPPPAGLFRESPVHTPPNGHRPVPTHTAAVSGAFTR